MNGVEPSVYLGAELAGSVFNKMSVPAARTNAVSYSVVRRIYTVAPAVLVMT